MTHMQYIHYSNTIGSSEQRPTHSIMTQIFDTLDG